MLPTILQITAAHSLVQIVGNAFAGRMRPSGTLKRVATNRDRWVDFPIHNRLQEMTPWHRSRSLLAFEIGSIQPLITHVQYRINSHPVLHIRRSLAKLPNKKLGH